MDEIKTLIEKLNNLEAKVDNLQKMSILTDTDKYTSVISQAVRKVVREDEKLIKLHQLAILQFVSIVSIIIGFISIAFLMCWLAE